MRIDALDTLDGTQRIRRATLWQPQDVLQAQDRPAQPGLQPADLMQIVQLMTQLVTEFIGQLVPSLMAGQMPFDSPGQDRPLSDLPGKSAAASGVPDANAARAPGMGSFPAGAPAAGTPGAETVRAATPAPLVHDPQTPAPQVPPVSGSDPVSAPTQLTGSVDGGGPNSLLVRNRTDQPITVAMFRNLAPGMHPNFNGPNAQFTIPAHGELRISVPDDWQGRLQKYSGSTQDPSNWAELNFEGSTGKIWFNESDIPGRNSSMLITAPDGAVAGSDKSVLSNAPASVVTIDSSGQKVIKPPQWFTGVTDYGAVDYLNQALGNTNAYVLPEDHLAVRVSEADMLTIDIGDP